MNIVTYIYATIKGIGLMQQAAQTGLMQDAIDRFETEYKSSKKGWDLGAKPKWVSNLLR